MLPRCNMGQHWKLILGFLAVIVATCPWGRAATTAATSTLPAREGSSRSGEPGADLLLAAPLVDRTLAPSAPESAGAPPDADALLTLADRLSESASIATT